MLRRMREGATVVPMQVCVLTWLATNEERLLPRFRPGSTHVKLWGNTSQDHWCG
jgi:hypothetical protein